MSAHAFSAPPPPSLPHLRRRQLLLELHGSRPGRLQLSGLRPHAPLPRLRSALQLQAGK